MTLQGYDPRRHAPPSSRRSSGRPPLGGGLGTGHIIDTAAATNAINRNIDQAAQLDAARDQGIPVEDEGGLIDKVLRFGATTLEDTGLVTAFKFIDTLRRHQAISMQDEGYLNWVFQSTFGPAMLGRAIETTTGVDLPLQPFGDGPDTGYGYEIERADYIDSILQKMPQVRERINEKATKDGAADALIGIEDGVFASAVLQAQGWEEGFADNPPDWWPAILPWDVDVPIIGMLDPKSLLRGSRFVAATGMDIAVDPISYGTGGFGGLGRPAASAAVKAGVDSAATRVVQDLGAQSAKKATSYVDDIVKRGGYSEFEELLARRTIPEAKRIQSQGSLNWADAVSEAMGYKLEGTVEQIVKGKFKGTKTVPLDPVNRVLQEGGVGTKALIELYDIIETKTFQSQSPVWSAWVDHAKRTVGGTGKNLLWTTGGLRAGIGTLSAEIPWLTDATRGLWRKGTQRTFSTRPAQAVFGTDTWADHVRPRWDDVRARVSRQGAEDVAARRAGGVDYWRYRQAQTEMPEAIARQLLGDREEQILELINGPLQRLKNKVEEWAPDLATANEVMRTIRDEVGTGWQSSLKHVPEEFMDEATEIAEMFSRGFREGGDALAEVFPEIATELRSGKVFRPFAMTPQFGKLANRMANLHYDRLIKPTGTEQLQAMAVKYGLSESDITTTMNLLGSFANRKRAARAYGETSEARMRKMGRSILHENDVDGSGFVPNDVLNDKLRRTIVAFADELNMTGKELKGLRDGSMDAVIMDPVEQLATYMKDVNQVVRERLRASEVYRQKIAVDLGRALDTALYEESVMFAEKNLGIKLDHQLLFGKERVDAQVLYNQLLESMEQYVDLPGALKKMRASAVLMKHPVYRDAIDVLEEQWQKAYRMQSEFPQAYTTEVTKLLAQDPGMAPHTAERLVSTQLLSGLDDVLEDYIAASHGVIYQQTAHMRKLLRDNGISPNDATKYFDGVMNRMIKKAQDVGEAYRQDYIKMFMRGDDLSTLGIPVEDLLRYEPFRDLLASSGGKASARSVSSAQRAADAFAEHAAKLATEEAEDLVVEAAELTARKAQAYATVLEATLAGEEIPATLVTKVVLPQTPSNQQFIEGLGQSAISFETVPYASATGRRQAYDNADSALFFYHPQFGAAADDVMGFMRHVLNEGQQGARRFDDELRQEWFDATFMMVKPGVFIPYQRTEKPFLVISWLPYMSNDQTDAIGYLQDIMSQYSAGTVYVDTPQFIYPAQTYVVGKKPQLAFDVARSKQMRTWYPDFKTDFERAQWILKHNRTKARDFSMFDSPAATKLVTKFDKEGARTRSFVDVNPVGAAEARAEQLGLMWDFDLNRWEPIPGRQAGVVRFRNDLENVYPIIDMSTDDISQVASNYPRTLDELRNGDWDRLDRVKVPDLVDDVPGVTDETGIQGAGRVGLTAEEIAEIEIEAAAVDDLSKIRDKLRHDLAEGLRGRGFRYSDRWNDIRVKLRAVEARIEAEGEVGRAVSEVTINPPNPKRVAQIQAGLKEDLARFGFDDEQITMIASDYIEGLMRPLTDVELGYLDSGLEKVLHEAKQREIRQAIDALPRNPQASTPRMMFPSGTRLDLPVRRTELSRTIEGKRGGSFNKFIPEGAVETTGRSVRRRKETISNEVTRKSLHDKSRGMTKGALEFEADIARDAVAERPWYNHETHIIITQKRNQRPDGVIDISRNSGTIDKNGWGNPYKRNKRGKVTNPDGRESEVVVKDTEHAVKLYTDLLWDRIQKDEAFADKVADLSGRTLWYWRHEGRGPATHSEPLADAADYLKSIGRGTEKGAKAAADAKKQAIAKDSVFGDYPVPDKGQPTRFSSQTDQELEKLLAGYREDFTDFLGFKDMVHMYNSRNVRWNSVVAGKSSADNEETLEMIEQLVNDIIDIKAEQAYRLTEVPGQMRLGQDPAEDVSVKAGTIELSTSNKNKVFEGDPRFSALNARFMDRSDKGRYGMSIEDVYQQHVKGYPTTKAGKGKPPKDTSIDLQSAYKLLWQDWLLENPQMAAVLDRYYAVYDGFTDKFAKKGGVSQADTLWEIATERSGTRIGAMPEGHDFSGLRQQLDEPGTGVPPPTSEALMRYDAITGEIRGLEMAFEYTDDPLKHLEFENKINELRLEAEVLNVESMVFARQSIIDKEMAAIDAEIAAVGRPTFEEATHMYHGTPEDAASFVDKDGNLTLLAGEDGRVYMTTSPALAKMYREGIEIGLDPDDLATEALDGRVIKFDKDAVEYDSPNYTVSRDPQTVEGYKINKGGHVIPAGKWEFVDGKADVVPIKPEAPTAALPQAAIDRLPTLDRRRPVIQPPPEGRETSDLRQWWAEQASQKRTLYTAKDSMPPDRDLDLGSYSISYESKRVSEYDEVTDWAFQTVNEDMESMVQRYLHRLFDEGREAEYRNVKSGAAELNMADRLELARQILEGPVAQARSLYRSDATFRKMLQEHNVSMEQVARNIRHLETGDVEAAVLDPHYQKLIALTDAHINDEVIPHIGPELTAMDEAIEKTQAALFTDISNMAEHTERQLAEIRRKLRGSDTAGALDFLERGTKLNEIPDLASRQVAVTEWLREFGDRKQQLTDAIGVMLGDDFTVTAARHADDGTPVVVIDMADSDAAKFIELYDGKFSEALTAMQKGELSYGEAYRQSIPQVAEAWRAQQRLIELLQLRDTVRSTAAKAARAENLRQYFGKVMDATQSALDTGNKRDLERLVMRQVKSGKDKGNFVPTPMYKDLLEVMQESPEHFDFLTWYVNSGVVAGLDVWDELARKSWWHMQRNQMATQAATMEQAINTINTATDALKAQVWDQYPPDEVRGIAALFEELLQFEAGVRKSAPIDRPVAGGESQFVDDIGASVEWFHESLKGTTGQPPNEFDRVVTPLDRIEGEIDLLEKVLNSPVYQAMDASDPSGNFTRNKLEQLLELRTRALTDPSNQVRLPPTGYIPAKDAGIDSGVFSGMAIEKPYANFVESTINNSQLLFSPYMMVEGSRLLKRIEGLWKAHATVVRPSFHIRNGLGGVWNGLYAGTYWNHYKSTWADVDMFRKRLRILGREGADHIGSDEFETEVLAYISKKNREAFRAAHREGTLTTSYSRAEHMYTPGDGLSWKPWETNFRLFQYGGHTMEYVEDHLRMATFVANFDPDAADLVSAGRAAHEMVNAVHFDYTNLTATEQLIKKFVPFYVWNRRNIPLQLRMLVQDPKYMLAYWRARENWNEQQLQGMEDIDPFLYHQSQKGWITPWSRDNGEGFARIMWDPQLPVFDLESLPWETTGPVPHPSFNPLAYLSFIGDNLGPNLSVPLKLYMDADSPDTNAPAGLNYVMHSLDQVPVVNQFINEPFPDETASIAPNVDYRITKEQNILFNLLVPYWNDYRAMLGVKPNNPHRAAGEGWLPGEDPGIDIATRTLLGPLGRTIGRGVGIQFDSPTSIYWDSKDVNDQLQDIRTKARYRIGESDQ